MHAFLAGEPGWRIPGRRPRPVHGLVMLGIDGSAPVVQRTHDDRPVDVAIQEMATAWRTGSELVAIDKTDRVDPDRLLDLLATHRIGRLFLPPAMLPLLAIVAVCVLVPVLLGARLYIGISDVAFRQIVLGLLTLSGLALLAASVPELWVRWRAG